MYKYCLFDWDGTLCDTLTLARDVTKQVSHFYKKDMTNDDFSEVVGDWDALRDFVSANSTDSVKDLFGDYFKRNIKDLQLNPNARSVLKWLKHRGIPIGIVTSSRKDVVKPQMDLCNISELIEVIIGAEDVKEIKPNPEPIQLGMSLIGGTTENTIFIGDTEKDIIAAERADVDSVFYRLASNKEIYGDMNFGDYTPTYTISDFIELRKIFENE